MEREGGREGGRERWGEMERGRRGGSGRGRVLNLFVFPQTRG